MCNLYSDYFLLNKKRKYLKRFFDLFFGILVIIILLIPSIFIAIFIKIDSPGPIFYFSKRVGRNKLIFKMPKFRTMYVNTPNVSSNRLKKPELHITKVGRYLRRYSLDEIPQLLLVISGQMSLVGPRPALYNQTYLINNRYKKKILTLKPGLTGLAQINGRDQLTDDKKIYYDYKYLNTLNFLNDLKIIFKTIKIVITGKNISH